MKLYTRRGDTGQTRLGNNEHVDKDHLRIATYGAVDELNATLGLALAACGQGDSETGLADKLRQLQGSLFVLGAELADPDRSDSTPKLGAAEVTRLETWIDEASAAVPPLKSFVLPSGCELAVRFHLARTTCRRAERMLVTLSRHGEVGPVALPFVNRLSDLLFAWARLANALAGVADIEWHPPSRHDTDTERPS